MARSYSQRTYKVSKAIFANLETCPVAEANHLLWPRPGLCMLTLLWIFSNTALENGRSHSNPPLPIVNSYNNNKYQQRQCCWCTRPRTIARTIGSNQKRGLLGRLGSSGQSALEIARAIWAERHAQQHCVCD